jgi:hypothetical protein
MSDLSSVDEHHRHALKLTPPLPTTQPSVSAMPSTTTMPTTPAKGGTALLSRTGSVMKWDVRRRRGTSSKPSEAIGILILFLSISFKPFSNLPFPPAAELQSHDNPDCTPRPETSIFSFAHYQRHRRIPHFQIVLAPQKMPNTRVCTGFFFFELLVPLAALGLLPHAQDLAGGIASNINRGEA